MSQNADENQN